MLITDSGLSIVAYSTGTTRIYDPSSELYFAEGLNFKNGYPGGLFLDASFYVPRPIAIWWALSGCQRVVFREGQDIAYEGYVWDLDQQIGQGAQEGVLVNLVGAWGDIAMKNYLAKPWADSKIDEQTWPVLPDWTANSKYNFYRNSQLMIYPKALAFGASAVVAALGYYNNLPTGQTIKRVTFHYDFAEGGQNWSAKLRDSTNLTDLWTISADGSGDQDITLSPASSQISWNMWNGAAQTAPGDDSVRLKITNLVVYTETGSITPAEVAKDLISIFSEHLNSYDGLVGANTRDITPFIADDDSLAEILAEITSHGDTSNNRWGYGLRESAKASTPNGKPVLFLEQYPPLTDYDIVISGNEDNLVPPLSVDKDFSRVANDIIVRWSDENSWLKRLTSADDATLKDQASIDQWRRHQELVQLGYSTQTTAANNAKRVLATWKDPKWIASSPVRIGGWVRRKGGDIIPTSLIRGGMRLKLDDVIDELTGDNVILFINGVSYDDDNLLATCTCGQTMDPLMTLLTPPPKVDEKSEDSDKDGGDGGEVERLNWKKLKFVKSYANRYGVDLTAKKPGDPGFHSWKRDIIKKARHVRG